MVEMRMDLCETHIIGRNTREWIVSGGSCLALRRQHILATGLSDAATPYRMVRLAPGFLHALVCTGGEGRVLVDGEWKHCGPGQAYLSPLGNTMGFHAVPRKRWQFAWIFYAPPSATRLFAGDCSILREGDSALVESCIRGLHLESQGHSDSTVLSAWAHLLHAGALRVLKPPAKTLRLRSLWQEVEGNLTHRWTMTELASKAGVSCEHLRRLSWEEIGRSPIKQVTFLRLQKAAHLLQTTQLKIAAVAESTGYEDAFAFSTAFKRHMGCCPSAYGGR